MSPSVKKTLISLVAVLVIIGAAAWIYWREFKTPKHDVELHTRVGEVMAEQTAMIAGKTGKIVLITIPTSGEPELKTQLDAFRARLKALGDFQLREYEMDTKDQDKYGVGTGLSGRRYVRTANKNLDAAAVVSFIGAPHMKDEDVSELQKVPKLIAEARSVDHLPKLFKRELISVVVASRFAFPAPGPIQPRNAQERFDKRYQIVVASNVTAIPKPE
ncbi:MAG: hypothetical protein HOP33_06175 [Verrucomicrobia bacterium]|nr:hypothetical protein [Verrucomicrobiota bacterium]